MIEGQDILYFSADDWDCGITTSQTHIATTLAEKNRILYINSIGLRKPTVSATDVGRAYKKLKKFFQGIQKVRENIWVFTPIVIPFHQSKIFQKINKLLMVLYINLYRRKLKMKQPIFWTFLPNLVDLIGKFNESKVIYY
ncbi:hypothetical protein JXJ21_04700, partial [candidate division KSB1 bacterium]|nr:hypothetical protein [candidate division KSB1 bacterium]